MKKLIMKSFILILIILNCIYSFSQTPQKEKGTFENYTNGFYENEILRDVEHFDEPEVKENKKYFKVDFSGHNYPNDKKLYKEIWHQQPVCQGNSGTCWCYSTTSFMESESKRISNVEVKLSEMFTVYWEYVERAKDFVKTRGKTSFSEGSEAAAIPRIWGKYGIVPYESYEGKPTVRKFNSHRIMVAEMTEFLNNVKTTSHWNEDYVVKEITSILNSEMGTPPKKIKYNNVEYTPQTFLSNFLKLKMSDYFNFMSTNEEKFYEKHELVEADNWWHYSNYYNIPVEDFIKTIKSSIQNGYSVCICGDISEPGYDNETQVAIIPSFDIPTSEIDDNSRQLRLKNGSTTDDHCIHIVGFYEKDGEDWYLIKDSNGGAYDGNYKGYRFFREDFVKLKMMNIMIYKEAGKSVLDKIIK